jgi:cyclopropane fatty-acyl-phospholipid synthase-like methyltransferase
MRIHASDHSARLKNYYESSNYLYDKLLWGTKHFGYHPKDMKVKEKEAQLLMQDLIGERLQLSESMRVLDAGCGQGGVAAYLAAKYGCHIEGVTILPFEIEKAKCLSGGSDVRSLIEFSLMDYSDLKFSDSFFDAVYTIESLVHSPDVGGTLREFARVLKGGGRLVLFEYTMAEDDEFSDSQMTVLGEIMRSSAMDSLVEFRHNRFQEKIEEAGFRQVEMDDITENVLPSLQRLRKFFYLPYLFVKTFRLQNLCPNTTAAVEGYDMGIRGLIRYKIFSAEKQA